MQIFVSGPHHPMKPQRLVVTHSLILNYGLGKHLQVRFSRCKFYLLFLKIKPKFHFFQCYNSYKANAMDMCRFHAEDYINFLQRISPNNAAQFSEYFSQFNVGDDW